MLVALAGLMAGFAHVLSGPDHLAAVAPLVSGGRDRPWRTGMRWGLGHVSGVLLVGLVMMGLRGILPVDRLSGWSEQMVGVVLIGIGLWGLFHAFTSRLHAHGHSHEGHGHIHLHAHEAELPHPSPRGHVHLHAAFAVGIVHGLAGSSHILGILPALALPARQGAVYLLAFAVGTVLAMIAFSEALGFLSARAISRGANWFRGVMAASGAAALAIGIYWLAK